MSDPTDSAGLPLTPSLSGVWDWKTGLNVQGLTQVVAQAALHATLGFAYHRAGHPHSSDPFTEAPTSSAEPCGFYRTEDGWMGPMWTLPPTPGVGSGEPVLLCHTQGFRPATLDYSPALSLAVALRRAGYAVFLWSSRADPSAIPPSEGSRMDVDGMARQDLAAAIGHIQSLTGFPRVMVVGHGLGGQAAFLHLADQPQSPVAALATISAAAFFPRLASRWAAVGRLLPLLPPHLRLPTQAYATLCAPQLQHEAHPLFASAVSGPTARGALVYTSADLAIGLAAQLLRWWEMGHLTDATGQIHIPAALKGLPPLPLFSIAADDDLLCSPKQAHQIVDYWPGPVEQRTVHGGYGHLGLLLDPRASGDLHQPLLAFLEHHRRTTWLAA